MQPEKGPLQVTFDNNKRNNYWSYHSGRTDKIHITGKYNYNDENNVALHGTAV